MKSLTSIEIHVPDKYFNPVTGDPIIGLIKCLREQGKTCEFLGFNEYESHSLGIATLKRDYVILLDGMKYHGEIPTQVELANNSTFYLVEDCEHDYKENLLISRTREIHNAL